MLSEIENTRNERNKEDFFTKFEFSVYDHKLRHYLYKDWDRGSTVVKVLCYNRKVVVSIPAGVSGIFH